MFLSESTPVADYAPDPASEVSQYPFRRPQTSFITDGERVTQMPESFEAFTKQTDEFLAHIGAPLMKDRVAVVAYGANSNPTRLDEKMTAFGDEAAITPAVRTVPSLLADIPDTVVAWHGKPGQSGGAFAELYKGHETAGESARTHVSFLTPLQLALLHATEGITYHLVEVKALAGEDRVPIKAYAYVAGNSSILMKDGKPVHVSRQDEAAIKGAMTAEQAVDYMLKHSDGALASQTARELSTEMAGIPLAEKKRKQALVEQALGSVGMSKKFSFPAMHSGFVGRAAFNLRGDTIGGKHQLVLAEQAVAALRPSDPALRHNRKTDIAAAIRQRAHDESADYLAQNPPV